MAKPAPKAKSTKANSNAICGFDKGWGGICSNPANSGFRCAEHADAKCCECGAAGSCVCRNAGSSISCGAVLCQTCREKHEQESCSQRSTPRKNKGGRPSKYLPEYAKQAEKLCQLGATDQEIADFFGVEVRTIYRWKADHDKFCQSLKAGKEVADERVERSLFQRATGYEQDEVKIFLRANDEKPVYAPFREKVAPDTTAAIFWLKNRRPELWRDKVQQEISGPDGGPIEHKYAALTDEQLAAEIAKRASALGQ